MIIWGPGILEINPSWCPPAPVSQEFPPLGTGDHSFFLVWSLLPACRFEPQEHWPLTTYWFSRGSIKGSWIRVSHFGKCTIQSFSDFSLNYTCLHAPSPFSKGGILHECSFWEKPKGLENCRPTNGLKNDLLAMVLNNSGERVFL